MNFVVAFMGEAQPLIEFYQLQKVSPGLFKNNQHSLILSGPGREKTISATTSLGKQQNCQNQAWLNIGIAGHGTLNKGDLFIAGKLLDVCEKECFYPPQIYDHSLKITPLTTLSQPSSSYQENMGFDMEAHSFYRTAIRFSVRELIQVSKIVSDNPDHPVAKFHPKEAHGLISRQLSKIDPLVTKMDQASKELQPDQKIELILHKFKRIHPFSVTRTHQLHDLIRQVKVLKLDMNKVEKLVLSSTSAGDAIRKINHFLNPHRALR